MCDSSSEDSDDSSKSLTRLSSNHLKPIERRLYLREKIPEDVESRALPLKELQVEIQQLQEDYCRELYELEVKYHEDLQHYYEKREKIIKGMYEPYEEEQPLWKFKPEEVDLKEFTEFFEESENLPEYYNGVPNFWLHIFRISDTIAQLIYEPDVDALRALANVDINYDENSFTLEFYFYENPYFYNNVLTKQYFLKKTLDVNNPFDYEGSKICSSIGCTINWKSEMNLTMGFMYKQNGRIKLVPKDSFFNFFDPPIVDMEQMDELDDETRYTLHLDFKIGNFFREEIIPKAVLYFTGDKVDDGSEDDAFDDDEEITGIPLVKAENKHIANVARLLTSILNN